MTEAIKPVSHQDDDAFIAGLRLRAMMEENAGNEEIAFIFKAAADKIELWKSRCESVQADFERAEKAWDKEMSDR